MSQNTRFVTAALNSLPVNQRVGQVQAYGTNLSQLLGGTVTYNATVVPTNLIGLMLPTGSYYIKVVLNLAIAAAANNIRLLFAAPDGLVLDAGASNLKSELKITGVVSQLDPILTAGAPTAAVTGGTTSAWVQAIIEGGIRVTSQGTLQLLAAQNVSGATNTQVLGGSIMEAFYISP